MRILVVEDEKKVAKALCDGLEAHRYDVDVAATGAFAAMLISDFVPAADRPSRYNATANKPMTTGPRPYSAPRASV